MNNGSKKIISELISLTSILKEMQEEENIKEFIILLSPLISWINSFETIIELTQKDIPIYKKLYEDSKCNPMCLNLIFTIIKEKINYNLNYLASSTDKDIDKSFIGIIKELLTKKCS